jgi:hypothetical protein
MTKDEEERMAKHGVNGANQQMDEKEQIQHVHAIDKLVHELKLPAEVVNQSYREILAELQKDARVKAFLPVLVSRSVKERLTR